MSLNSFLKSFKKFIKLNLFRNESVEMNLILQLLKNDYIQDYNF